MPDQNTTNIDTNQTDTKTENLDQKTNVTPSQFELTVDGEKKVVTIDEMRDLAQKSAGADKRFQEASELRKQAEDGLRMKTLVDRLSDGSHTPTSAEITELAGMIGVDPAEFAEYLASEEEDAAPAKGKSNPAEGLKLTKEQIIEALGFDPAEAKAVLDYSHQRHVEDARKQIRDFSDQAVDKDEIFGKMIVGENGKDRSVAIKDMVAEDVLRRIQDGNPFGADLVAASIQKVRAHLTKFGIPGNPSQYPVTLGLGPGGGLPAEVQSETPIKRVSAAQDTDDSNFVARAMQRALKAMRGG
jgi:hypothetical protein